MKRRIKKKSSKARHIKKYTKAARQELFLRAFRKSGIVSDGVRAAKIERHTVYEWKNDPAFVERYEEAEKEAINVLEKEALRRSVKGTQKPVFYQGVECGRIREYSDTLLMFILKKRDPSYRDKSFEVTGKDGKPLQIEAALTVEQMIEKMRPDDAEAELARMEAEEKASAEETQ